MKITISAGSSKVERTVTPPPNDEPRLPFELRRQIVQDKVVQNRRSRMRAIAGGKVSEPSK